MNSLSLEVAAEKGDQDRIWLDAIVRGGRMADAAIEALFRKYRSPLIGFLMRRSVTPDQAEDLVQETFIRMVKAAPGFRHDAKVSSWLFRIAANLHVDEVRKNNPEQTFDEDGWAHIEGAIADGGEAQSLARQQEDLHDCFDRGFGSFAREFPARAEALQQVVVHKWSMRDVAAFLNRTEGATREFLSQSRKKLREYLKECREFLQ